MSRESFLRRVAAATRAVADPYSRPLPRIGAVRRPRFRDADGDLTELFIRRAGEAGATVHESDDVAASVAALVEGRATVLMGCEPILQAVPDPAPGRVIRWPDCGVAAAADADAMVSGVTAAIAVTGSLVLSSGMSRGRTAGLLAPVHVAVVDPGQIVATPSDVLTTLNEPGPSAMLFVTGPSRTADIEHQLTIGVHGPEELHIIVAHRAVGST